MGYTHYWTNKSTRKTFTKKMLAQLKEVLDYWQEQGVICFERDQPQDPYLLNSKVIRFNGKEDGGCETFYFALGERKDDFCKTRRESYDQCVCEILILLGQFLGKRFEFDSDGQGVWKKQSSRGWDGTWEESWKPAYERLGIPLPQ